MVLSALLAACAVSEQTKAEKTARKELLAQQVREGVENRHFTIDVRVAHPLRGRTVQLTSPYDLSVRGDTIISYLPYFGRAYFVPYGGGKGLNFEGQITAYEVKQGSKGKYVVNMMVQNDEDEYFYFVTLFDNGSASVDVSSRNRDRISFSGSFNPDGK